MTRVLFVQSKDTDVGEIEQIHKVDHSVVPEAVHDEASEQVLNTQRNTAHGCNTCDTVCNPSASRHEGLQERQYLTEANQEPEGCCHCKPQYQLRCSGIKILERRLKRERNEILAKGTCTTTCVVTERSKAHMITQ